MLHLSLALMGVRKGRARRDPLPRLRASPSAGAAGSSVSPRMRRKASCQSVFAALSTQTTARQLCATDALEPRTPEDARGRSWIGCCGSKTARGLPERLPVLGAAYLNGEGGFEPPRDVRPERFSRPTQLTSPPPLRLTLHLALRRRGWDSNPRDVSTPSDFQGRRLRPLGHPARAKCIDGRAVF
jgi:hypothetical protein